MKILFSSYFFSPSVGGIETVSALLAPEFVKAGHEVIIVTTTPQEDGLTWPFKIYRNPSPIRLLQLTRWCDVYFQNNISLSFAWPLLLVRRPWVIAHHTWIRHLDRRWSWKSRLKRILLKYGSNATISRAIAQDIPVPSTIVGNPYSDHVFKRMPEIVRDRELVYLGRLVSDKGVDLLIESLVHLRNRGKTPRLTIIGSGSEEGALRKLAHDLGVGEQVEFTGSKNAAEIARLLNAHQILVVPSHWREPFGIVALEGIASGCVVVASHSGGLPEVVGPCGVLFKTANKMALTDAIEMVLTQPDLRARLLLEADQHLNQFKASTVAAKYLQLIARAIGAG